MAFKKLPKSIPKPSTPIPALPPLPPSTALSLSSTTAQNYLTHFLKTHLKPFFTPQDLLTFLKTKLHHHPTFTHFDLYIFNWASSIDSFRHDHTTYEWMVRTLAVTDRFSDLRSVLHGFVTPFSRHGAVNPFALWFQEKDP